ncbi:MAG: GntR family transcriptional regulator [Pseudomonadota bacterium]
MSSDIPAPEQGPKYRQLANLMLSEIESGQWKPGDRLPSEAALAERWPASLGTVQKALNHLADSGVVVRQHGRGTFVAGAETPAQDLRYFRFLDEGGNRHLPVFSHVLAIGWVDEQGPWAGFLETAPQYLRLQRRLSVNGEFDLFSEMFLAGDPFAPLADLEPTDLDGILIRDYLSQHFSAPTLRVQQSVRCGLIPPRVAPYLGLARDAMGLIWHILSFGYRDKPLIFQRAYVPPSDRPVQFLERL